LSDPEAGNEGSATVVQGMSGACPTYRQHSDTAPTERGSRGDQSHPIRPSLTLPHWCQRYCDYMWSTILHIPLIPSGLTVIDVDSIWFW